MPTTDRDDVLALACRLIEIDSVSPADKGCQDLLRSRLEASGFHCHAMPFADVDNLWATHGDQGPLLVFAGHTDVVPPGPEADWQTPPFNPEIKDGMLYGRGAADMKGSLAAMVIAAERFVTNYPDHSGRLGFLITSDEEADAIHGTRAVMNALSEQDIVIDWCLVGEPSSQDQLGDVIRVGRRGSLNATLTVKGIQGHVAYPDDAVNPIHRLAPALAALVAESWDQGNAHFPATSLQVSNIHAGTGATNVVPGHCEVRFNFRYSTESTAEALKQRTSEILDRFDLDYQIDWALSGEPFLTMRETLINAVTRALDEATGVTPTLSTSGGTSDGRFIAPYGTEVVELGPVNATIHKVNECVRVADLPRLASVYEAIMKELLAAQ